MKDYLFLQKQFVIPTYTNRGVTFVEGKGAYLIDTNGIEYLDMMSNYGVSIFGYNHPLINEALISQIKTLISLHGSFSNDIRSTASQQVINHVGISDAKVYWSSSGAEAIEAALKFAVLATGKKKFISATNSYHGKTLGALSLIGTKKYREPFEPLLWNVEYCEYGSIESIKQYISKETAAVVLEPVQGEGGITFPPDTYIQQVKELCVQHNALLIIDEIQTGMGRTGTFLAMNNPTDADIICLGKGLAGGIPVGATIVRNEISEKIPKGLHTSTFGGNPLASAGVISTLSLLTEKQLTTITELGEYFLQGLKTITSSHIVEVRGKGLMVGVQVSVPRDQVLKQLQQHHILAIPAGEDVIRFLPPYIVTKKELDQVVEVLDKILKSF